MSDFTSNFWEIYIGGITLVSIIACLVLLFFTGKVKATTASDNTTGHVWDGDLREMNNPLPRWWSYMFGVVSWPGQQSGYLGMDFSQVAHR
jgi:cytochrome c oxidase cbb3-type subunit III